MSNCEDILCSDDVEAFRIHLKSITFNRAPFYESVLRKAIKSDAHNCVGCLLTWGDTFLADGYNKIINTRALTHSAVVKRPQYVRMLCEHGADVHAYHGTDPVILLYSRVDDDGTNAHGVTIDGVLLKDTATAISTDTINAIDAKTNYTIDALRALVEFGADIDSTSTINRTPLMTAASYNCCELMKVILELGANIEITDTDRRTALDVAKRYEHHEAAVILQSWKGHMTKSANKK